MTRLTITKQGFRIVSVCENRPRVATRGRPETPTFGALEVIEDFVCPSCYHGLSLEPWGFSISRPQSGDTARWRGATLHPRQATGPIICGEGEILALTYRCQPSPNLRANEYLRLNRPAGGFRRERPVPMPKGNV